MTGSKVYHPFLPFVLTTLFALPAASADIRISEIMVAGQSVIQDEDGAYPDWIEIENTGSEAVSLNGWHLTDRADRPSAWTFPAVNVPAGGPLKIQVHPTAIERAQDDAKGVRTGI
jgi:Lamin Tail Domain